MCTLIWLYIRVQKYQNMSKLRFWPLAFASYKTFLKNRSVTSLPALFSACFLKKNISHSNCPNVIVWLSLVFEISDNMCITVISLPVDNVIYFEINLRFLIKPLSYMTEKPIFDSIVFQWNFVRMTILKYVPVVG